MNFKTFKIVVFSTSGIIFLINMLKIIPYTHPFIKEIDNYMYMVLASIMLILTWFFRRTYFPFETIAILDDIDSVYRLGIKVNKKITENHFTIIFNLAAKFEGYNEGFKVTKELSRKDFLKLTRRNIKKINVDDIVKLLTYYELEYLKPQYVKTDKDLIKAKRIYKLKNHEV